jgi:hypothetical protein
VAEVGDYPVADVSDELKKFAAVHRWIQKACSMPVPVRIQTAATDLHDWALLALRGQSGGADLSGYRGRQVK